MARVETLVRGFTLVDRIERCFDNYLAIDDGLPLVLALWSVATHVYDCFDAFPYLGITSATKRSGKTRTAEVLELFCCSPQRTVSATPAVLFRSIERRRPTLIIDEAEVLSSRDDRSSTLREVLNAGYRKGQTVSRCVRAKDGPPGEYDIQEFATYCPKALVLIGKLPDTLSDRTIPIRMRRRLPGENVARFTQAKAKAETQTLRDDCQGWVEAQREQVAATYAEHAEADILFLEDREAELWLPLFTVCRLAAPHRIHHLERVARRLAGAKAADDLGDIKIRLLNDVREIMGQEVGDRISTVALIERLTAVESAPWNDFCQGKPLDSRALGNLLRAFGISPQNIRFGRAVVKGYLFEGFRDAFLRYLPATSATPLQDQ